MTTAYGSLSHQPKVESHSLTPSLILPWHSSMPFSHIISLSQSRAQHCLSTPYEELKAVMKLPPQPPLL